MKDNLGLVRNSELRLIFLMEVATEPNILDRFGSLVTTKNKIIRLSESMRAFNELRDKMASG
ncbi:MAG: hypothetical protein ACLU4N_02890 [Butyricimonas faecihominis]